MNFYISGVSVSDANAKVLFLLTKDLKGWLFGNKGYLLNQQERDLLQRKGYLQIFSKCRKNMAKGAIPIKPSLWIRKQEVIELLIDITKNQCDANHSRHRSPFNAFANLLAALLAYSFRAQKLV